MTRALGVALTCAVAALTLMGCGDDRTEGVFPQLVRPQDAYDFGPVPVLNARKVEVPVLNVGRANLKVHAARIKEADVPFAVVIAPEEVGSSEEKPVEVSFTPPEEQDYTATLLLETDDGENPLVEVQLLGKGSTRAIMELDPLELDFGRVAEGTSAVQTFTIHSKGSADLIVEEIAFVDGSSAAFEFIGSVKTPAVVATTDTNGLPGKIQVTVRYTVEEGAPDVNQAQIRVRGTDPDQREVLISVRGEVNRAPIPVIEPLGVGAPGMVVTLDGSMSSDPDDDTPLTYRWTLRSKPLGATTTIRDPEAAVTTMILDQALPGEYVVELNVTDANGAENLRPARATIVAAPAEKLLVEMFWTNPKTDMDLHFLRTPQTQVDTIPDDCFYQNKNPDWGVPGDPTDDPYLKKDAKTGFGPEVVGYVNPIEGTFRVVVEYHDTHGAEDPLTDVTVRVYRFGKVEAEFKKTLTGEGQYWGVADIEWPSGVITPIER